MGALAFGGLEHAGTVSPPVADRRVLRTPGLPMADAVCHRGFVATAGIVAFDPVSGGVLADDAAGRAGLVLDRLLELRAGFGAGPSDVLHVEGFLADASCLAGWASAFDERFGSDPPARTTMICGLVLPGLLVEAQALAAVASP